MTLSIGRLSAALEVEETTLRAWISHAEATFILGRRDGGRRVFDFPDAYALAIMAALYHARVRVSPQIIKSVLSHIVQGGEIIQPKPGETLEVSESEGAAVIVYLDLASEIASDRLNNRMVAA